MIIDNQENRIFIFTGHFGSGKTAVAINFSYELKKRYEKVNIIDMDIVNPFFRTDDAKNCLSELGINVLSPNFAGTNVELPSLPREIPAVLEDNYAKTVIDVGGDDVGAKILSTYREYINMKKTDVLCVINTCRPITDTKEKIKNMVKYIEMSSRLKISGLVNNTNIADFTTAQDVFEGHQLISKVSREIDIPIYFVCTNKNIEEEVKKLIDVEILTHTITIKAPWM